MRNAIIVLILLPWTASAQEWQPVTIDLLQREKPGYGGLSGVAVDHATGHVFVNVSDRGVFKSTDQGKTWERHGPILKGRTETPGCLIIDPTGKTRRIVMATVYGGPIAVGATNNADWTILDKKSTHVDWCAVNWTDPDLKFMLAFKHEAGGLILRSRNGGKSFDELGKGNGPAWVFDTETAVVSIPRTKDKTKGGIYRTTNGGKSFELASDHTPLFLPRWHDDTLYWLADGALIVTSDRGATWKKRCELKDGRCGPVFGKNAKHLFVLTGAGVVESTDGGTTWARPIALPREIKGVSPLTWLDYDPLNDALYVMKMTSELYRYSRKPTP